MIWEISKGPVGLLEVPLTGEVIAVEFLQGICVINPDTGEILFEKNDFDTGNTRRSLGRLHDMAINHDASLVACAGEHALVVFDMKTEEELVLLSRIRGEGPQPYRGVWFDQDDQNQLTVMTGLGIMKRWDVVAKRWLGGKVGTKTWGVSHLTLHQRTLENGLVVFSSGDYASTHGACLLVA